MLSVPPICLPATMPVYQSSNWTAQQLSEANKLHEIEVRGNQPERERLRGGWIKHCGRISKSSIQLRRQRMMAVE